FEREGLKGISLDKVTVIAKNQALLKNMSFSVKLGSTVLISGKSGSGKTTLLKLISGLILPTKGIVSINGKMTQNIDYNDSSFNIAYQCQKPALFNDSLRRNIDPHGDYTDCEIMEVLNQLGLHYLKLEGKVCDSSRKTVLSEGEKMRVLIARVILRKAKICLLDEPFAPLDDFTAEKVWECIMKYLKVI
ncbi:MAG: ATP-binding cassette domain-containing protein, partial [Desulfovibrionales bacterium]|nr:ATP-binding cassette domain-containing protein [Desulfovibrionales bacterium]